MKALAPTILAIFALLGWLLFTGCAHYKFTGSLSYQGEHGDYSLTSDGKTIATDIKLKNPKGYAK